MKRITIQASKELRAIPGVRNFGAHIGQALSGDEVVGVNFGENWISVDPDGRLRQNAGLHPGGGRRVPRAVYRDVQTYLKERIREVLTGASEAIVVRIYGEDLEVLRGTADEVLEMMQRR